MALGTFLRQRRKSLGLSAAEVGKMLGISQQSVSAKERGQVGIRNDELEPWARALKTTARILEAERAGAISAHRGDKIAVINRTPAGVLVDHAEYGISSVEGYDYIERDRDTQGDRLFAIEITGESMAPRFHNGDIAVCQQVDPTGDEMPRPGRIVFIRLSEDAKKPGCMICRWYPLPDGMYRLDKENPAFASVIVSREHVEQFAVVIQRREKFT